jgi:hypothetical protein
VDGKAFAFKSGRRGRHAQDRTFTSFTRRPVKPTRSPRSFSALHQYSKARRRVLPTKRSRNVCTRLIAVTITVQSHCGFDEPRGANTVRYDSFVRDMTTWSVISW